MVRFFWGVVVPIGAAVVALPIHLRESRRIDSIAAARSGPTPMVLVADGRTGSSIAMVVLATLTNSCAAPGMKGAFADSDEDRCWLELFGGRPEYALQVENPKSRMTDYLSRVARVHANSTLVGFQWKTYRNKYKVTRTPEYKATWQYLGEQRVHVLRWTRNELDVFLSHVKHETHENLPAHCQPDDKECIKMMLAPLVVDVDALMQFLRGTEKAERELLEDLGESNIQYMNVTYEELVDNYNATSRVWNWQRALDFLGVRILVTEEKLDEAFGQKYSDTRPPQQGANVQNWEDVVKALRENDEGRFAGFLRTSPSQS